MKNEAIGKLLKRRKAAVVFHDWGADGEVLRQYIGEGSAIYPVDERLPILEEPALRLIYKLPEDEDKLAFRQRSMPFCFDLTAGASEAMLQPYPIQLQFRGVQIRAYKSINGRLILLDAAYLTPLSDMEGVELYLRETVPGQDLIAAKQGLDTWALIAPILPTEDLTMPLEALSAQLRAALDRYHPAEYEDEQLTMEEEAT